MGFGLLFFGYVIANIMSMNILGGLFSLAGYIVVICASNKLRQYNNGFNLLLLASVLMTLLSLLIAIGDISSLLLKFMLIGQPLISEWAAELFDNLRPFFDFAFTTVLCLCVRSIAKETGVEKIQYKAVRNIVFFCISFVLQILVWLSGTVDSEGLKDFVVGTALPVWAVLVYIVCVLFVAAMIFSCYSKICDIDDVEMHQKPSRFAFVNRRREQAQKRRQSMVENTPTYTEEQKKRAEIGERQRRKHKK